MAKNSEAYELARHIHDSFFGVNDFLAPEEIAQSGIRVEHGVGAGEAQRLTAIGAIDGHRAYQTLTLGRNGVYFFSTTFTTEGGDYQQSRITPNSPLDKLEELAASLYICALIRIAVSREE